jgi:16S rRNA (guanine966-N2)-methyltransferase
LGDIRIVAGQWGRRRIRVPRGPAIRPTSERVREAWLNVLGDELDGATVLDLFAGTGALGLEALSRGARHATFVENDRHVLRCLRANIQSLGAGDQASIFDVNVFRYLDGLAAAAFDLAFADPPYGAGLAAKLVKRYMLVPFARLFSVEHAPDEVLELPTGAEQRRYGDTVVTFISSERLVG